MNLRLEPINETADNPGELYASSECPDILRVYKEYYPKSGFNPPWIGYFVINDNTVAGCCGFTSKPDNGRVEIAYHTFKPFEGQGISSGSCTLLVSLARNNTPSLIITAKTAPEKNASVRILEKNGFVFSKVVQDHEIGDAWEWELK